MKLIYIYLIAIITTVSQAQNKADISGNIKNDEGNLTYANVYLKNTTQGDITDENGNYTIKNVTEGDYIIVASFTGYKTIEKKISINSKNLEINFTFEQAENLDEIVVTGTLKPVSR